MSMYIVALPLLPVLFALLYILFRSGPQAPTLGHHLLASGSVLHHVRRG